MAPRAGDDDGWVSVFCLFGVTDNVQCILKVNRVITSTFSVLDVCR